MNKEERRKLAKNGESQAASYLISVGYEIISKNYFSAYGEIDIIASKDKILSFIEVKTRNKKNISFDQALNSVTRSKQKKIKNTADIFLSNYDHYSSYYTRFDVIILLFDYHSKEFDLKHLKDAFC
ncbi:MAG: YraN family protein [Candidatus Cloacimonetes bacterium]|nr:YraN family protein [Candidatus Cloacimonadota bacterium]